MHIALLLGLALLAVNLWATRRVWRYRSPYSMPRGMLIAMVWVAPFIGAWIAVLQTPAAGSQSESAPTLAAPPAPAEPAPEQLLGRDGQAWDLMPHIGLVHQMPLLDWAAVQAWAALQGDETAQAQALEQGRHAWLLHLRQALWPHMRVTTTPEAYLLSALEDAEADALARYVATARQRVTRTLGDLARLPPGERTIILVLDSEEDYYHYVSIYYPEEGEFAFSGGMFIHAGCPHFVVVRSDLATLEPVIAHELTHSALAHWHLPKWLDEGLAVNTEHRVAGVRGAAHTPQELHRMHQAYWTPQRIQAFWTGESFDEPDQGSLLSYDLARILVQQLGHDWPLFTQFAQSAQREDGGSAAAKQVLNVRLGALAAGLFGVDDQGLWEPSS
jgi:hypothetical protein